MTVVVATVLPIFVGRAVDVAFRLGLAFSAAVEAVAVRPAVLSCSLFTIAFTSASEKMVDPVIMMSPMLISWVCVSVASAASAMFA